MRSDALVFFGATGDLAHKQIFPALVALVAKGLLDMPVVCVGRSELSIEEMRKKAKEGLDASGPFDRDAWDKLAKQLRYARVDYDDAKTFDSIKEALGGARHPLHYVALPPETYEAVAKDLAASKLNEGARLALEKPFGNDEASAHALAKTLHPIFEEDALFRIDHFLGKEAIENLVYFRAANPVFDDAFRNTQVERVEITMAESFGVEGRAEFYDAVGAIRDVVQNHLLEVVAHLAMELPAERGHAALRRRRGELLAQVRPLGSDDVVRGQVRGYRDVKGVAKDSKTETFAALRLFIDSERWRGVPFHIRTGKSMATTATEAVVQFKSLACPVLEDSRAPAPNRLRFDLGSEQAITLGVNVKKGGRTMAGEGRQLVLHRASTEDWAPYVRLLADAFDGDLTLFAQQDEVEASWRVVDPVLSKPTPLHAYEAGSWGPKEADKVAPEGGFALPG